MDKSEDGLYSVAQAKSPEAEGTEPKGPAEDSETGAEKDVEVGDSDFREKRRGAPQEPGIDIEFSFTADDEPDQIKKAIQAARQGLAVDLDDIEDSSTD